MKRRVAIATSCALLICLSFSHATHAKLIPTHGGALVTDTTNGVTWVADGRLIITLANASGDPAAFVDAVIAAAGGVIYETPHDGNPSGIHVLTKADFGEGMAVDWRVSWYGGQAFVKYLNSIAYQGYTDWRLPTTVPDFEFSSGYPDGQEGSPPITSSEMATLFYGQLGQVREQMLSVVHNDNYHLFTKIYDFSHWSATELGGRPEMAWYFSGYSGWLWHFGYQSGHYKDQHYFILPIRTGITTPLLELSLGQAEVAGCKSVNGKLTLSGPAPASGTVVTISDTLASAIPPESVTVPAGATTKTFSIKTTAVAASENGLIHASLGSTTMSTALTVRPMGLTSITLTPTSAVGSQPVTGKATLECKAGPGPVEVVLESSKPTVANPVAASIFVPQGAQSATFDVTTNPVLAKTTVSIKGTANGISKSKSLTVTPAASVSATRLAFGNQAVDTTSAPLSVTLTNKGAVPFSVTGISLTGTYASWFAQTNNCPASLDAGASCTISVTFTPQAAASKSAKLTIATSATSTPLSVSLSGTGI